MALRPLPELTDDVVGNILLRLPPEDPECLVRAAVVCKPWYRLLSDPGFPRRYREIHRSPPLLGILRTESQSTIFFPRFIPIKNVSPISNPRPEPNNYILDCRHGRVLLLDFRTGLIIWDPITDNRQRIGQPKIKYSPHEFRAVVLCADDSCDHLDCHGGHSLVVFLEIDTSIRQDQYVSNDRPLTQYCPSASAFARVYSTETGEWNAGVSSAHFGLKIYFKMIGRSLLTGHTLYFIIKEGQGILKYDIAGGKLTLMSAPPLPVENMALMEAEGGGLGACSVKGHSLNLWAWRTGPGGILEWQSGRVIQLDFDLSKMIYVVDFAEGAGSVFVIANKDVFAVDLKSGRARKIGEGRRNEDIFPFISFYIPALGAACSAEVAGAGDLTA